MDAAVHHSSYEPAWCPWLFPETGRLQSALSDIPRTLLNFEHYRPELRRKRARRPADVATFEETVMSLLAHASYEHLRGAGVIRISLDGYELAHASRYRSPLYGKQLPRIVHLLSAPEMGFLAFTKGEKATAFSPGRQSTLQATPKLIARLERAGATVDDIGRKPGEEVVLLKGDVDKRTGEASFIEYDDDEITEGYRLEVRALNEWLATSDICYLGTGLHVDDRDRHLKRYFTRGEWGSGGRLFGAFWQSLPKGDRLANVEINGDPVVSIDFSAMALTLCYAQVKAPLPEGDLYDLITFRATSGTPLAIPRDIVKKIVAARLNGAREWPEDCGREHWRPLLSWRAAGEAIKAAHPAIAALVDANIGQSLAFAESEVLLDALQILQRQEVVALPVHDCLVIAKADADAAEAAMREAFAFHFPATECRLTREAA